MAYDIILEERITRLLQLKGIDFEARKMMGGLVYMVDQKMCVGIVKDQLMARINPEIYAECIEMPHCSEMNFTGRPMKGYVFITPEGLIQDHDLDYWVQLCLDFNPLAKASKKKKKKT